MDQGEQRELPYDDGLVAVEMVGLSLYEEIPVGTPTPPTSHIVEGTLTESTVLVPPTAASTPPSECDQPRR